MSDQLAGKHGVGPRFWEQNAPRTVRRANFWVPGPRYSANGQSYQRGPMFVEWEAPPEVTRPYPIVLVHGGAVQGTEWTITPDGRPGWSQRLVDAGYVVLVVDRPTQGRSPFHPDVVGAMGPPFSYEEGRKVFFPAEAAEKQTQWPFDPDGDGPTLDAFIAAYGPLPVDIAGWQEMDADRLADLLDQIGPAIVMTHSASGADGWLVADRRPQLVAAIVTVEPMGPPFATTPNIGTLSFGLTAAPITFDPPLSFAEQVQAADPASLRIPALTDLPVAVVSGETSPQAKAAHETVAFLAMAGAAVDHIHLPNHGVFGNGHGLIYEMNSDAALQPVLDWLIEHTPVASSADAESRHENDPRSGTPQPRRRDSLENSAHGAPADGTTMFVTYAGDADTRFDRDYFVNAHLPLVMEAWSPYGLLGVSALFPDGHQQGVIAVAVCRFRDAAAVSSALAAPRSAEVMADVTNYTDSEPIQSRGVRP